MKKIRIIILSRMIAGVCCLAAVATTNAQGIEFVHDLDSALALAKAQNKPVFIDFYTSWCAPCKQMTKEVFPQENVGKYFNEGFINCKVQCDDNGKGVEMGKKYEVGAYPTLMFLDKDGKMMHSVAGGLSGPQLIELASVAFDSKRNLASLVNEWEGGRRDTAFVHHYLKTMKDSYRSGLASKSFEGYFKGLDAKQKTSAFTFDMIRLIGYMPASGMFTFVEQNHSQYYKTAGRPNVNTYMQRAYEATLKDMALTKGSKARNDYFATKTTFAAKTFEFVEQTLMYAAIFETFDSTGKMDIVEYQRRGTAFLNKYGEKYFGYTLMLSSLLGNCTGRPDEGVAGIKWMEDLIARDPKPSYYQTYIYITWRNYQWDKALDICRQVRDMNVKNNRPTTDIDAQIVQIEGYKEKYAKKVATSSN